MANKKIVNEISSIIYSLPWYVARDEGYFKAEGFDVEFVRAHRVKFPANSIGSEDPRTVNSIKGHIPFEKGEVKVFRACEEGNVRRAYDLDKTKVEGHDVRVTSVQPSRPVHAVVTWPGSAVDRAGQLSGKPIAVNFYSGSHFAAIRLLEGFVGQQNLKLQHFGGPEERFKALLDGKVVAAVLMEPYISLAEKHGGKVLAEGSFVATDVARDDLTVEERKGLYRALNKAADFLNESDANKRKYLPYLIDSISDDFPLGRLEPDDFHLPRQNFARTEPYPEDEFNLTRSLLIRYNLVPEDASFAKVVDNAALVSIAA